MAKKKIESELGNVWNLPVQFGTVEPLLLLELYADELNLFILEDSYSDSCLIGLLGRYNGGRIIN